MQKFLIDVNVPRVPAVWFSPVAVHAIDLQAADALGWTDTQIWEHALENGFTIVSKDADFTQRLLVARRSPHVVHIRLGNMRLAEFRQFIEGRWARIAKLSAGFRLVDVYRNRIEQRQ